MPIWSHEGVCTLTHPCETYSCPEREIWKVVSISEFSWGGPTGKILGLNIGSIFFLWAAGLFLVWETVTHGSEWMPLLILAAWKHGVSSEPHLPFAVGRASQHPFNLLLFLLPVSFCAMPLFTLSLAGLSGKWTLRPNLRFRIFIKVYPWNQHLWEEVEKNQEWGGGKVELWCSPSDSLSWPQGGLWR